MTEPTQGLDHRLLLEMAFRAALDEMGTDPADQPKALTRAYLKGARAVLDLTRLSVNGVLADIFATVQAALTEVDGATPRQRTRGRRRPARPVQGRARGGGGEGASSVGSADRATARPGSRPRGRG